MKNYLSGFLLPAFLLCFTACDSGSSLDYSDLPSDSLTVEKGKTLFLQNCSACHDFRQDGIGPQLGGVTDEVPVEWLQSFIKDPKGMIDAADERATNLYEQFHSYMPSFAHFEKPQLHALISYLHTIKAPVKTMAKNGAKELEKPISEPISFSDLSLDLELITQMPATSDKNPLARIAKLDYQPGTDDLFVLDLRGKLYQLKDGDSQLYLDIAALMPNFIDQPGLATGSGSFAFHPEFAQNGLLYTTHTEAAGSAKADFSYADSIKVSLQWVISEWETKDPTTIPFNGNRRELFRVNMVGASHGVQELTFNPLAKPGEDNYGLIYIGIGDGGSVGAGFPFIPNSLETIWGTIVRINPKGTNSKNGNYGIPPRNPFADGSNGNALAEIYALGFRNPHRISWTKNGDMIASNIGQAKVESLYKILPGHNYGWPIREGTFLLNLEGDLNKVYPLPDDDASYNITYPIAQYSHEEGNAISGGFEYWGKAIPELQGKYIFGDVVNGRLFYIEVDDIQLGTQATIKELHLSIDGRPTSFGEMFDNKKVDIRFGRDHQSELWVSTKADGKIYKVTGASRN